MSDTDGPRLRPAPHSIEAEQAVLGAVLLGGAAVLSLIALAPSDFYRPGHRVLFEEMRKLAEVGPVDVLTLSQAINARGLTEKAGGNAYIAELCESTPSVANVEAYAGIVRERAGLRAYVMAGNDVAGAANADGASMAAVSALAELAIAKASERKALADVLTHFVELPDIPPVDWLAPGLIYRQGVYLFVGQPKAGKSSAMRTLAVAMATGGGEFLGRRAVGGTVAYCDFENPTGQAKARWDALAAECGTPTGLWLALGARTLGDPLAVAANACAQVSPDVLMVDGLAAFMPSDGAERSDGGYARGGEVMGALRQLAERHNCAVIAQHHAGWGDADDAPRALGSVALTGQADGTLAFAHRKDGTYAVSTVFMRDTGDWRGLERETVDRQPSGRIVLPERGAVGSGNSDSDNPSGDKRAW